MAAIYGFHTGFHSYDRRYICFYRETGNSGSYAFLLVGGIPQMRERPALVQLNGTLLCRYWTHEDILPRKATLLIRQRYENQRRLWCYNFTNLSNHFNSFNSTEPVPHHATVSHLPSRRMSIGTLCMQKTRYLPRCHSRQRKGCGALQSS